ncbi:MAG: response regulator [Bacteroidota bacterium]|nr:response regulator [Bacteroidota bacterium]
MSKVLIIDDDEMMLRALSNFLTEEGFTILTTADGPQGIMIYKKENPDVVILDLGLPSLDGRDVLKQILSYDHNAKIIIATGYGSSQIKEESLKNGAFGFFLKPFDAILLMEKIKSALRFPNEL